MLKIGNYVEIIISKYENGTTHLLFPAGIVGKIVKSSIYKRPNNFEANNYVLVKFSRKVIDFSKIMNYNKKHSTVKHNVFWIRRDNLKLVKKENFIIKFIRSHFSSTKKVTNTIEKELISIFEKSIVRGRIMKILKTKDLLKKSFENCNYSGFSISEYEYLKENTKKLLNKDCIIYNTNRKEKWAIVFIRYSTNITAFVKLPFKALRYPRKYIDFTPDRVI